MLVILLILFGVPTSDFDVNAVSAFSIFYSPLLSHSLKYSLFGKIRSSHLKYVNLQKTCRM